MKIINYSIRIGFSVVLICLLSLKSLSQESEKPIKIINKLNVEVNINFEFVTSSGRNVEADVNVDANSTEVIKFGGGKNYQVTIQCFDENGGRRHLLNQSKFPCRVYSTDYRGVVIYIQNYLQILPFNQMNYSDDIGPVTKSIF
jgi:hypothetical protein